MFWLISDAPPMSVAKPIKMVLFDKNTRFPLWEQTYGTSMKEKIRGKQLSEINFNEQWRGYEDPAFKKAKLYFLERELERITFNHDTNSIICIKMGEQFTFGDFYHLQEQLEFLRVKRYGMLDDNFYIFGNEPPELLQEEETERPVVDL